MGPVVGETFSLLRYIFEQSLPWAWWLAYQVTPVISISGNQPSHWSSHASSPRTHWNWKYWEILSEDSFQIDLEMRQENDDNWCPETFSQRISEQEKIGSNVPTLKLISFHVSLTNVKCEQWGAVWYQCDNYNNYIFSLLDCEESRVSLQNTVESLLWTL